MNPKIIALLAACLALCGCVTGCGTSGDSTQESSIAETIPNVAGAEETVPNTLDIPADAVPITADALKDGTYDITVDSSSSMFNITACTLTVADGAMTADMTMGGTGYLYVFMGKGADAADAAQYINFRENADGTHSFVVPVDALDVGIDCAAYSKKKEQWYDRTLLFRSDSLPAEAFVNSTMTTVDALGLSDGEYTVDVALEGGSGKAQVQSPARLTIADGQAAAEIIWSSSNYDYMVVDDQRIEPESTEENSIFLIPVAGFDCKLSVLADTTAMSTPHEIAYTLTFDSASVTPA